MGPSVAPVSPPPPKSPPSPVTPFVQVILMACQETENGKVGDLSPWGTCTAAACRGEAGPQDSGGPGADHAAALPKASFSAL